MTQPASDSEQAWDREDVPLDPAEMMDSDDLGSTDAGSDPLDDSWEAPDRPSSGVRYPKTPREERAGPSFDRLLAAEQPDTDPYLEAERRESGAVLDADVYGEGTTVLPADAEENATISTLIADDATDDDRDGLIAREAATPRTDSWAAAAEERALHLE